MSDQVALRAEHELTVFRPDAVILYAGWNDFQSYDPTSHPPAISYFDYAYGGTKWKQYATMWLKSVALASAWYHSRAAAPALHAAGPAASPAECYRFLLASLDRIVAAFRAKNPAVKIFVCTLVCRWPHGSPREWAHTPAIWWMVQHHLRPEDGWAHLPALNGEFRAFARSRGLPLIDTAAAFEDLDRGRLQWDWAHMYPEGYELLAWTMFDALRDRRIIEGQRAPRHTALLEKYRLSN